MFYINFFINTLKIKLKLSLFVFQYYSSFLYFVLRSPVPMLRLKSTYAMALTVTNKAILNLYVYPERSKQIKLFNSLWFIVS